LLPTEHRRARWANTSRYQASTTWPSGRRSRVDRAVSNAWSSSCSNSPPIGLGPGPRVPARAAPAGSGRSPLRPRSPRASSPSRPVFRPAVWHSLPHLLFGLVGRLMDLLLLPPWRRLGTAASTYGTLPHRRTIRWPSAKRRRVAGPLLSARSVAHELPAWNDRSCKSKTTVPVRAIGPAARMGVLPAPMMPG
jgi:hypothetical protein